MSRSFSFIFVLLLVCSLAPSRLSAQTSFGSITGTVTDSSGAPVPQVNVTLTSLATGEKRSIQSGGDGTYQFVNLNIGDYRIDAEKSGFKHLTQQPVNVEVQNTLKIDIALQVGALSQTIEVTAQTPLLQPETSSLGQVVGQRKLNELPLNGRNPLNLVALVPSVVPQGGSMQSPTGTNPFAWGNYQIGGGMANQSSMLLDGAPLYISSGQLALVPTQDSLQEFKVQTNNLPAEFGRFAGGVINMTTKSGGNDLHGTAWEYLRNRVLNANDFFDNRAGVTRPAFTQNQFGANLGGPVYIPHVYDGRNKSFFFVDYEGFRLRQGQSFTETVPTLAERGGSFSNLRDSSGNQIPIYDPLTTAAIGNGQYTRTQFAGNVIPQNRLNPASLQLLKLYPLPNAAGNALTGVSNFVTNASVGGNNNQTVTRIDQNISDKQRLFARYNYWGNLNLPIDPFKTGVCQDRCTEAFNTNSFALDDVYSLSPTTILDVRVSYLRFSYNRTPETLGFNLADLGWPASLNSQVAYNPEPSPCITGFDPANLFCSGGIGSTIVDRNENYDVLGSLTKIIGQHTVKMGGEFLRTVENYVQSNNPTGSFNFDQNFTASSPLKPNGGSGLASFLLGYPSSGGALTPLPLAGEQLNWGAYVQDDWKVTKALTVNLGLRWNAILPWTERHDRESFFEPGVVNPVLQQEGLSYNGALGLVASADRSSRFNVNPNYKQFAPRVGMAYQAAPKTVLRAGYGISWLPPNLAGTYSTPNDFLGSFSTPYVASIDNGITPYGNFSNPFPGGITQPPGRNPIYQQQALGQSIGETSLNNPFGYAQQWNFDVQQELGQGFLVDVAYAGSKGTHLPLGGQQIDQLPDQYLALGNQLLQQVANPFAGVVQRGSLTAATVTAGQLLRPYPQYTGVSISGSDQGDSSYQSLQVKAEKRFSSGASFLVAYTHSKLISNTDALTSWLEPGGKGGVQDWNNLRAERSVTSFDVPDRLVVSYVIDLPFGKGRRFLSSAHGAANLLVGGWGLEGVTTVQTGFPLHLTTAQNLTNSYGGNSRPNALGNASISGSAQSRLNRWFDVSRFTQPAAFTFGNEGRNDPSLRASGVANWDFSTFKNFPFGPEGKLNLQFRAEFFNIFNRVQFGAPGQTYGTAQFGVVSTQQNLPRLVQFALRFVF